MPDKKQHKAELKREKKAAKAAIKAKQPAPPAQRTSAAVRYAEIVRGVLYLLLGASLIVALALGQRGAIMSLDDLIDSLFAAWTGKIILALIAIGLAIYGLKHLRVVR